MAGEAVIAGAKVGSGASSVAGVVTAVEGVVPLLVVTVDWDSEADGEAVSSGEEVEVVGGGGGWSLTTPMTGASNAFLINFSSMLGGRFSAILLALERMMVESLDSLGRYILSSPISTRSHTLARRASRTFSMRLLGRVRISEKCRSVLGIRSR